MAAEIESLIARLGVDFRTFERGFQLARGVMNRESNAIERRGREMESRLGAIGKGAARGLVAPLAGIAATLTVRELIKYSDAWVRTKNSLAVAGVEGEKQKSVLDALFQSAQRNAAPVEALSALYGKAAQASDVLGASQAELIEFTDGIAVALRVAGTGAGQAQGALTQLGQLLGQARVQAEEFNSVNEGARPILQAVARGIDEAGGSVSKLKQLVNDGKISGQEFFQAFLKGLPELKNQAAAAAQTFDQAFTKIENAFTRYIGSTDESLGASQRVIQGLNSIAENFDGLADSAAQVAAVIVSAMIGSAIGGLVIKVPLAIVGIKLLMLAWRGAGVASAFAAVQFGAASKAALGAAMATRAFKFALLGAAAGPVLGAISAAVAIVSLFSLGADDAAASTETAADMANRYADALQRVRDRAGEAGEASVVASDKFVESEANRLNQQLKTDREEAERLKIEIIEVLARIAELREAFPGAFRERGGEEALDRVVDLTDKLGDSADAANDAREAVNALANAEPKFQHLADTLNPILDRLIGVQEEIRQTGEDLNALSQNTDNLADFGAARGRTEAERAKNTEFFDERTAEARRTEDERRLDDRTDQILKEAEKLGLTLSKAAARIQAKAEIMAEGFDKLTTDTTASAAKLIAGFEDFRPTAYWDVNAYRTGFGSDTMTDASGGVSRVTKESVTTISDAMRDLQRRIAETQADIIRTVGDEAYSRLSAETRAALISVAYNYGELPKRLIPAIQAGDVNAIAAGVEGLGSDNGGVNQRRRTAEAANILGGPATDALAAMDQQSQARADLIAGIEREVASLGLEAQAFGQTTFEAERARVAFDLLEQAKAAGLEITPQLKAQIDALAIAYANATVSVENMRIAEEKSVESQEVLIERMDEFRAGTKDVLSGFISDLRDGKTAAEALGGVLDSLADKMIDLALDNFVNSILGAPGTAPRPGGLLGGSIIPGILHEGGIAGQDGYGHGRAVSPSVFAGAQRYHSGGLAGLRSGEVPAILQRGELVVPRMGRLGAPGGMGQQQRFAVDSTVQVSPTPWFFTQVDSRVRAEGRAIEKRMPGQMAEQRVRFG